MRKTLSLLLVLTIIFAVVGCGDNLPAEVIKTPKEKAVEYVEKKGVTLGATKCVAYQDYFLNDYYTYFIVYDSASDAFSFECYKSDRYFDTPPTDYQAIDNLVKINLATQKAEYYSNIRDNTYTGTATINIDSYSSSNYKLSEVSISGKYAQVYKTIEQTFEQNAYNTVIYIDNFLRKEKAEVSIVDFGFVAFVEDKN